MFGRETFGHLARATSLCGACKEVCPVDIDLPRLLLRVRAGGVQAQRALAPATSPLDGSSAPANLDNAPRSLRWGLRLYRWAATSPRRFGAAQALGSLAGRVLALFLPSQPGQSAGWLRLPGFTGWGQNRDFPQPAANPFRQRWQTLAGQNPGGLAIDPEPGKNAEPTLPQPAVNPSPATSLRERFAAELTALGGTFTPCPPGEAGKQILVFLQQRGIGAIQAWEEECLPDGLLAELRLAGVRVQSQPDPNLRAGLTGARAAIAESGTLVLPGGPGQPQTASLLPEIHLAVLRESDIYENLLQVFTLQEVRESSLAALVSGPSRTADIEMTLSIGVHGPSEVHVFCIGLEP